MNSLSKLLGGFFFLLALCGVIDAKSQQDADETIDVRTRVVFVDTLVRDKKTGVPVRGLTKENFRVLADGRPRVLSYFGNDGVARTKPLALLLVMNLYTSAILYLEKPEVMEQVIAALDNLLPEDEVAVMQTWYEPDGERHSFIAKSKMVEGMTRDRAKTAAALRDVQRFARRNLPQVKMFFSLKDAIKGTFKEAVIDGMMTAGGTPPTEPPFNVTIAPDYEYMTDKAVDFATQKRPNSQVVIADVTDDFGAERYGSSADTAKKLIASGATINGLIIKKNSLDKMINVLGHVISPLLGQRFHTTSYYSRQTGGDVATVGRPEEFAKAINGLIGNLAARYNLGFTLDENERNDGRMHKLEVKVIARDTRGKKRNLKVNARRGYYVLKAT